MTLKFTETSDGIRLKIKVVPGASRTRFAGLLGDALKINIAAAPEKGKANKELIHFLAKRLNIPQNRLTIISGQHGPRKDILIRQTNRQNLLNKIEPNLK